MSAPCRAAGKQTSGAADAAAATTSSAAYRRKSRCYFLRHLRWQLAILKRQLAAFQAFTGHQCCVIIPECRSTNTKLPKPENALACLTSSLDMTSSTISACQSHPFISNSCSMRAAAAQPMQVARVAKARQASVPLPFTAFPNEDPPFTRGRSVRSNVAASARCCRSQGSGAAAWPAGAHERGALAAHPARPHLLRWQLVIPLFPRQQGQRGEAAVRDRLSCRARRNGAAAAACAGCHDRSAGRLGAGCSGHAGADRRGLQHRERGARLPRWVGRSGRAPGSCGGDDPGRCTDGRAQSAGGLCLGLSYWGTGCDHAAHSVGPWVVSLFLLQGPQAHTPSPQASAQ